MSHYLTTNNGFVNAKSPRLTAEAIVRFHKDPRGYEQLSIASQSTHISFRPDNPNLGIFYSTQKNYTDSITLLIDLYLQTFPPDEDGYVPNVREVLIGEGLTIVPGQLDISKMNTKMRQKPEDISFQDKKEGPKPEVSHVNLNDLSAQYDYE